MNVDYAIYKELFYLFRYCVLVNLGTHYGFKWDKGEF